jgi:hypothetical protein
MRTCWIATLSLAALVVALAPAANAQKDDVVANSLILQFNGKAVEGVEAQTKNTEFRPIFEKELAKLAEKLPGKPAIKISHWYTVINGCAVRWEKGTDETAKKAKEALEKLPYVKSVEYDRKVGIGLPK